MGHLWWTFPYNGHISVLKKSFKMGIFFNRQCTHPGKLDMKSPPPPNSWGRSVLRWLILSVSGGSIPLRAIPTTVNVEIFAQYIFSRISRMVSDAQKYDMSEYLNRYRINGIRYKMRENMSKQKCQIGLDAQKFSSAKISTFTVSDFGVIGTRIGWQRPILTNNRRF